MGLFNELQPMCRLKTKLVLPEIIKGLSENVAEEYGALPAEGFDLVLAKLASTIGGHKKSTGSGSESFTPRWMN